MPGWARVAGQGMSPRLRAVLSLLGDCKVLAEIVASLLLVPLAEARGGGVPRLQLHLLHPHAGEPGSGQHCMGGSRACCIPGSWAPVSLATQCGDLNGDPGAPSPPARDSPMSWAIPGPAISSFPSGACSGTLGTQGPPGPWSTLALFIFPPNPEGTGLNHRISWQSLLACNIVQAENIQPVVRVPVGG